jgi:hypothetical protein
VKTYCKAYRLGDLRAFPAWAESAGGRDDGLGVDDIAYVWDDFTVVRTPVLTKEEVIMGQVTQPWRDFCLNVLGFAVPRESSVSPESGAAE